ncbi:hypothetical protein [Paenibacillus dendritiformis]|nr:hypothetical protein [Paenibacillus dendritiformis]
MEKPNNPGMSEEAWKKLHKYISKLSTKYEKEIKKMKGDKPA